MKYSHDHTPFMLWSRGKGGNGPCTCCRTWGVVKPNFLLFPNVDSGEEVADRYRKLYPAQEFIVATSKPAD
jgi:hypothetical protein